jgi:UDP-2,4-diacetamido-2,4,6-trideoxy-beta-L-altropyranose hydrolase
MLKQTMISSPAQMHFFFRCDSSQQIGGGHLVRSLALAEQLRELGFHSEFFCKDLAGSIHSRALDAGFKVHLVPKDLSQEDDADFCRIVIGDENSAAGFERSAVIIVDNYDLDQVWESEFYLRHFVMVIDDSAARKHLCHLLLDYNFHLDPEKKYQELIPPSTARYFGPSHILFRKEFRIMQIPTGVGRKGLLVFFGMTDSTGETLRFIKSYMAGGFAASSPNIVCKIILPKSNRNYEEIKKINLPKYMQLIDNPSELISYFFAAELYFGSGGTITWERLRCGLPGIVVAVAENQIEGSKNLADQGFQLYLGPVNEIDYSKAIQKALEFLDSDEYEKILEMQKHLAIAPFDPAILIENTNRPRLRKATPDDGHFLYQLRNDPTVNAQSITQNDFTYESHIEWLTKKLEDSNTHLYVVLFKNQPAGQVRVDADNVVSISVLKDHRGQGVARAALTQTLELHSSLTAWIEPQNRASLKLFEGVGFKRMSEESKNGRKFLVFVAD